MSGVFSFFCRITLLNESAYCFRIDALGNPRVEALHVPDVLKLVVSGLFLGFGFAGLMGDLNFPNSQKDQSKPPRNE
jgi:hypothetical protein